MRISIASTCLLLLLLGCNSADFGSKESKNEVKPATSPSPTPTANSFPSDCQAVAIQSGYTDPTTKITYKLLPGPLPYNQAVSQCQAMAGDLIVQGQSLPDDILRCRAALGVLWVKPSTGSKLALWEPTVLGTEDPNAPHWAICYRR